MSLLNGHRKTTEYRSCQKHKSNRNGPPRYSGHGSSRLTGNSAITAPLIADVWTRFSVTIDTIGARVSRHRSPVCTFRGDQTRIGSISNSHNLGTIGKL